ncbi:hypothetical protein PTSG_12996 [Salpingoeca rosetta]|uniref:Uncharacterized protein n=1 Tax=Salpingoeca rosetta (strain ATCC 50818 / BSB-021) TaxID=946362 RepID=F2UPJ3_SALR5|nr:uncharacterized protein PTSG_12996 [Salpingoeca rosetta]EGD79548.1 hypothetical protein PTSG_12996 [Salpingoeca rosetta]|eukprot:XP_004989029.1 hypothetical protein PTSG_12996 [Salpingoeca rosetta]
MDRRHDDHHDHHHGQSRNGINANDTHGTTTLSLAEWHMSQHAEQQPGDEPTGHATTNIGTHDSSR